MDYRQMYDDFPELFRRHMPAQNPFDIWGIQCGAGWLPLIHELAGRISAYAHQQGLKIKTKQIKCKFNSLRWYLQGEDDTISMWIEEVRQKTESVCQLCGAPVYEHLCKAKPIYEETTLCRPAYTLWLISPTEQEDCKFVATEFYHDDDLLYPNAQDWVSTFESIDISFLQSKFRLGYNRSIRLLLRMEREKIVARQGYWGELARSPIVDLDAP